PSHYTSQYALLAGNCKTAPTVSSNCGAVACLSSTRRLPLARRPGSGACQDIRRSNRACATRISTASVFPDSMLLLKPNPIEPPWYGPVRPVVWEGRRREVSPIPILAPLRSSERGIRGSFKGRTQSLGGAAFDNTKSRLSGCEWYVVGHDWLSE